MKPWLVIFPFIIMTEIKNTHVLAMVNYNQSSLVLNCIFLFSLSLLAKEREKNKEQYKMTKVPIGID